MLGKLLKYELKSTSRMMGVLYLAVLVVAAVVGFIARGMILGATQGNAIAVVIRGLDADCIKSNQLTDLDFTEYCGTVRIHIRSCTDRYAWQWSLFSDRY